MPECFLGCTGKEYPCEPPAVLPRTTSSRRRENPPSGIISTTRGMSCKRLQASAHAGEVTGLISAGRGSDGRSGRRRCFRSRPNYDAIRCFCKVTTAALSRSIAGRACCASLKILRCVWLAQRAAGVLYDNRYMIAVVSVIIVGAVALAPATQSHRKK